MLSLTGAAVERPERLVPALVRPEDPPCGAADGRPSAAQNQADGRRRGSVASGCDQGADRHPPRGPCQRQPLHLLRPHARHRARRRDLLGRARGAGGHRHPDRRARAHGRRRGRGGGGRVPRRDDGHRGDDAAHRLAGALGGRATTTSGRRWRSALLRRAADRRAARPGARGARPPARLARHLHPRPRRGRHRGVAGRVAPRACSPSPPSTAPCSALHHPPVPVEVTAMARLHLDRARTGSRPRSPAATCARSSAATSTTRPAPCSRASRSTWRRRRRTRSGSPDRPAGSSRSTAAGPPGILSLYDDGRVGYSPLPGRSAPRPRQHARGRLPHDGRRRRALSCGGSAAGRVASREGAPWSHAVDGGGRGAPARTSTNERAYSPNTIDAYGADLADLVRFAATQQVEEVGGLDLELLRDWLWEATERGLARATIARRAAAARSLTGLAAPRRRSCPRIPGARLRAPKAQGRLPRVVGGDQLRELFDGLEAAAAEDEPGALRDLALLELIYGSALRVSEACGVDVDDVDLSTLTVRVTGKGAKDRVVPFGVPASRAITAYRDRGRPVLAERGGGAAGAALFLGDRGGRHRPAERAPADVAPARGGARARARPARTRSGTPPRRTCSTAARTSAPCRRCSATRASGRRRSTRTCRWSGSPRATGSPTRAADRRHPPGHALSGSSTARSAPPRYSSGET